MAFFPHLSARNRGVFVDRPELTEIRPTKDVEVIVEIATLLDFYALEERLRASGFRHDTTKGAQFAAG